MFTNVALDVFIGLVFIFLLYSLLATIIQEFIATRLAFRSKVLEKAILRMLEDGKTTSRLQYGDRIQGFLHLIGLKNIMAGKTVAPWFYAHPLIKYLAEDNFYSKPAYLDAENFSKVMIDLLKGFGFPESQSIQSIHNSVMEGRIYKLPINLVQSNPEAPAPDKANPAIKILRKQNENVSSNVLLQFETVKINTNTALYLRSIWLESGADLNLFRQKLENWFDDTMKRATGWYKRYTLLILFFIGLLVAYAFNVDTIAIHRILSKDKSAREQLVQMAISYQDKYANEVDKIRKGDTYADTLLKTTFDKVSGDAELAGSILGLGRVWVDSSQMYEDSLQDPGFRTRMNKLQNDSSSIQDSMLNIQDRLIDLRHQKEISTSSKINKNRLTLTMIQFKDSIAADSMRLVYYQNSPDTREYNRMKDFISRGEFIKAARKDKWNLYSPNQAGGWETFFGWIITALAITLGAPFWFDLLSKLIKIRGVGNKNDALLTNTNGDTFKATSSPQPTPVAGNVNLNSGEEAVG